MVSLIDIFEHAMDNMRHRKLRSWLTILGIVIGIASLILLVSIGQGLDSQIKSQLGRIGTKYVVLTPGSPYESGASFGPPQFKGVIYESDAEAIRRLPGVKAVSAAVVLGAATMGYKDEKIGGIVMGTEPDAMDDFLSAGFEKGKYLADGDESGVVLGYALAKDTFEEDVDTGKTYKINGKDFKVRGIINKGGSFSPFDSFAFIDIGAARELGKTEGSKRVDRIIVITNTEEDVPIVEQEIIKEISRRHKVPVEKRDFTTNTPASISASVSQITEILSYFLGMIAFISIVVSAVGIANSMFTSVLERTREIGILKAVGATEKTITHLFLIEAGLIGLAGGLIGAGFGVGLTLLLGLVGVPSSISLEFVIFTLLLSVGVGVTSGYFPSRDAARLQPVEALRYE